MSRWRRGCWTRLRAGILALVKRNSGSKNRHRRMCGSLRIARSDWRIVADASCFAQYYGASLRYDPGQRWAKTRVWEDAIRRLVAGEAPETIGLPNLGVPLDGPRGEPGKTEVKTGPRSAKASP